MVDKNNYTSVEMGEIKDIWEKQSYGMKGKYFLKEHLGLTSCEVSLGAIPANKAIPFLHSHKENEETYIFIQGNGIFYIDGEKLPIKEGSVIKVKPDGVRGIKAGTENLIYFCIQAKENTLNQSTKEDGIISDKKPIW